MRALVAAILVCTSAPVALAQSYSANGQVGYLGEWEMKASRDCRRLRGHLMLIVFHQMFDCWTSFFFGKRVGFLINLIVNNLISVSVPEVK